MKKVLLAMIAMLLVAVQLIAGDTTSFDAVVWMSENREIATTIGGAIISIAIYVLPPVYSKPITVLAEAIKFALEKLIWASKTKVGLSKEIEDFTR